MMMVPAPEWEERHFERCRDQEALRNVCWSILDRTIRDLFTYRDRRTRRRAWCYDTAFNWLFQHDPGDAEVPMSFTYVCGTLDLNAEVLAKAVWEHRHLTFKELKEEMKRQEKARAQRELQRQREEDDYNRDCSGDFELPIRSSWSS